ncbi:MAG: hypothetical protein Q4D26_12160 [Clostridia bacterium]|nr:hypothetical protein [Clostridia bacterium]
MKDMFETFKYRYNGYWNDEDYGFTILEKCIYIFAFTIEVIMKLLFIVMIICSFIFFPVWIIPYLIYRYKKLNR